MATPPEKKQHFLMPATLFASAEEHEVTTILGSCISVCLFDPRRGRGGINHFMLPLRNGEQLASPKYGNIAIAKLIEQLARLGCHVADLRAKLFGGGMVLSLQTDRGRSVGESNILIARELLAEYGIPVVASDVGGACSRRIVFNTRTGDVMESRIAAPNPMQRASLRTVSRSAPRSFPGNVRPA